MDEAVVLRAARDPGAVDPDEQLAVAARTDAGAFGRLYERHRIHVYRYLRTRARSEDEALDLTAITFEKALVSIDRYRPRGAGFAAWLLRIARNTAIDAARRPPVTPLPDDLGVRHADGSPETLLLGRERRSALVDALATLSDLQREAIALRFGGGLTAAQIGAVIGKSAGATQQLLYRAMTALREELRDDD